VAAGILVADFARRVGDRLVFQYDHSTFLYNVHVLWTTFPRLLSYNPWWNAGALEWEPVRSGTPALVFPLSPLLAVVPVERAYAWALPALGWLVLPLAVAAAARFLGVGPWGALAAGLIALMPDQSLALWLEYHGVPGFLLATAMAPVTVALVHRLVETPDPRLWHRTLVCAVFSVGIFWMLFGLMVAPALLLGLLAPGRPWRRRLGFALLLALLAALHAGWVIGFLRAYDAGHVLWLGERLDRGALGTTLRELGAGVNLSHLLAVGGVLGLAWLGARPARRYLVLTAGTLLLVALVGPLLNADLQFRRFLLPLALVLAIPAGHFVEVAGRAALRRLHGLDRHAALLALLLLVLTLPLGTALLIRGRPAILAMPEHTRELAGWLRAHVAADERVLFAGRWGPHRPPFGGQLAYLQALTGKSLIADYYHYPIGKTDEGRVPDAYRTDPAAFARYLTLYNVAFIVIRDNDREWMPLLRALEGHAVPYRGQGVRVVSTNRAEGLLLRGCGTVELGFNRIRVTPCRAGEELVIRAHFIPGLRATPGAALEPHPIGDGRAFLRLRAPTADPVDIRY
jgi:hypothetical protein